MGKAVVLRSSFLITHYFFSVTRALQYSGRWVVFVSTHFSYRTFAPVASPSDVLLIPGTILFTIA